MMSLHRCKRCHGKLIRDRDEFGWYEQCIQCGHLQDVDANGEPELVPVAIAKSNPEEIKVNPKKHDYPY
jgi:hypothetical protein